MKPSTALRLTFLLLILTGPAGQAQRPDSAATTPPFVLPPLEEVIRLAVDNSPEQHIYQAEIKRDGQVIQTQKRLWTQYFFVDLQASTGNQALLLQQATGDVTAFQNYNNGYRATLNMRLPVEAVVGRKPLIRAAQAQQEATRERMRLAEQKLVSELIPRYYAVQTSLNQLQIKADGRQSTLMARQLAEREFREGQITAADLTHTIESAVRAASEYEETKQRLFENLHLLENLTGTKLTNARP
jgi:outer membrane protein TolC